MENSVSNGFVGFNSYNECTLQQLVDSNHIKYNDNMEIHDMYGYNCCMDVYHDDTYYGKLWDIQRECEYLLNAYVKEYKFFKNNRGEDSYIVKLVDMT